MFCIIICNFYPLPRLGFSISHSVGNFLSIFRCWNTFQKWHLASGYTIWIICLLIYKAPRKYYFFTALTLALETSIITFGPYFIWLTDAPFKAGISFISEYSVIIAIRWIVVVLLEFEMFQSILHFLYSLCDKVLKTLRSIGSEQPRNADGTFAAYVERKSVGRPKKQ